MSHSALDALFEEELKKWKSPGLAVTAIKNDDVVFAKGYGVTDIDDPKPVDVDTLFAIGSCTKAFTTMGLALLIDEGKLTWDTPIREYMPDFRLYDEFATAQMTARDLVCHRSGLPRHDLSWYGTSRTRKQLYESLRYLKPTQPFRYVFQYQNLMYMTAGCLIEAITGQTWEVFTQQRIFDPLGMSHSNLSTHSCEHLDNAARPHRIRGDIVDRIPYRNLDAIGPAGSINSNMTDMAKWLRIHLNGGKLGEEQWVSEDNLKQMHAPHMPIPITPATALLDMPDLKHHAYGLGWATQVYRGHVMVRHTGGIDGFITQTFFLPEHNIGIVAVNNGGTSLSIAASYMLLDQLMELDPIDWTERYKSQEEELKKIGEQGKEKLLSDRHDVPHSRPLEEYAGTYEDGGYGTMVISFKDDTLSARYNGIEFSVTPHHYEIFRLENEENDILSLADFGSDLKGKVNRVSIRLEPTGDPIEFAKQNSDAKKQD